jgi:hypothetical protein
MNLWKLGENELEKRQAADQLVAVTKAAAAYVRKTSDGPLDADLGHQGRLSAPIPWSRKDFWRPAFRATTFGARPIKSLPAAVFQYLQAVVLTTGGRGQDAKDVRFATRSSPRLPRWQGEPAASSRPGIFRISHRAPCAEPSADGRST